MAIETKIKKKIFVKILAPKDFQEQIIGEAPVTESRLLLGRKINVNLMTITNDPKDQNIQIKFNINELKGADSVGTELLSATLLPAYIRRLVRKEKSRIDNCFTVKTQDNKNVVIKTFFITINIVTNSILTSLRKKSQEFIRNEVAKMNFDNLVIEVLSHKLQDRARKELNKVYPLKQCEVREIKLALESKKKNEEAAETTEVKTEAVESAQTIN
jgi:small subunit ribosomal protein S3Ae